MMKLTFLVFIPLFFWGCSPSYDDASDTFQVHVPTDFSLEHLDGSDDHQISQKVLKRIHKYEYDIKKYSQLHDFDWRLIVALILQESRFKEQAVSHVGARGLMQIMPRIGKHLEETLDIDYIYDRPTENIAAGIYHLKQQRNYFEDVEETEEQLKLALAAYNGGIGHLFDALAIVKYKKEALCWENIQKALMELGKSNYEFHLDVWKQGKPRYGYFENPKETVEYVNNIWGNYSTFKQTFE